MKRNSFLRLIASAGALIAVPFNSHAVRLLKSRLTKGFKVDAGADRFGQPISLLEGDTFFTKVSAKDTDGDMYVFESTRVKKGGPSLHIHHQQDE